MLISELPNSEKGSGPQHAWNVPQPLEAADLLFQEAQHHLTSPITARALPTVGPQFQPHSHFSQDSLINKEEVLKGSISSEI